MSKEPFSVGVLWYGGKYLERITEEIKQELLLCATDLAQKSADEAPKASGDLKGNCAIDVDDLDQGTIRVGYNLPYAARQHEELEYNHTDGKAKYLEDPFNENKRDYVSALSDAVSKGIKW